MTADVLSDALRAVRLTGAVYFDFELSSPWVAEAPPSREIAGNGRSNGWDGSWGLSRSVMAERFTEMVGQPPMQYLALWRMQLAARLLVEGGHVAAVAGAVGYESEAAFSRAFKKLVGQAPATWRRVRSLSQPNRP